MELFWSGSTAQDFQAYEIHMSTSEDFTPGPSTLKREITSKETTDCNVTGLKENTTYYFIVRVTDTGGLYSDSNMVSGKTLPPNMAPVVEAGPDITTYVNQQVRFSGSAYDEDGTVDLYQWDFDGDGKFDYTSTESGDAKHTYTTVGAYTAVFRATDNEGATAEDTLTVTVNPEPEVNMPPTADAGEDMMAVVNQVVYFNGTGYDTDGYITLYEWDYDGDGIYDDSSFLDGYGEYTYYTPGTYRAKLRVTDDKGAYGVDTVTVTVKAENRAPVAKITSPKGSSYTTEDVILFDGSGSYDPDGDDITFTWTADSIGKIGDKPRFAYTFSKKGNYVVTLKVCDSLKCAETQISLRILEPENMPPTLEIYYPSDKAVVSGIVVVNGKVYDGDGRVTQLFIKIDSGSWQKIEVTKYWSYTWNTASLSNGLHKISVKAVDDKGDETTKSVSVTVSNKKAKKETTPGFGTFAAVASVALVVSLMKRRKIL